jgi:hypothetical protein
MKERIMSYPKTNEQLDMTDLARPLSLEAIQFFASDVLPKAKKFDSSRRGKFVRIGGAMVIGTTMDYGTRDYLGDLQFIKHWQLGELLRTIPDLDELARATIDDEPQIGGGLTDAGASLVTIRDGVPVQLELYGSSYDFGWADEAGRARTIEIAQALVGDTISVIAT